MMPTFFATPAAFAAWLKKHHKSVQELLVGFYKKDSGKPSMTWPESVDEALCYGWIDGVRRSVDVEAYSIRFTPRRATSHWSAVNIGRVKFSFITSISSTATSLFDAPVTMFRVYCSWPGASAMMNFRFGVAK